MPSTEPLPPPQSLVVSPELHPTMTYLRSRPWLWIVFAFVILIASWIVLLKIASEHRPASIEPTSSLTPVP